MDDIYKNNHPAYILFREVQQNRPEVYEEMVHLIRPHRIESLVRIFKDHLDHSGIHLNVFNENRQKIPNFLLRFVKCCIKNFPTPGDAFGIQLTCRITKNNTQNTLDSRHLKEKSFNNVVNTHSYTDKALKYELELYSDQSQILEIAGKRKYSSIFVRGYSIRDLLSIFPYESCVLPTDVESENAYYGFNVEGKMVNLKLTRFMLVASSSSSSSSAAASNSSSSSSAVVTTNSSCCMDIDKKNTIIRIVYKSYARDLIHLLKHLDGNNIFAYNDVKCIFQKCGITCYFFNMVRVVRIMNDRKISSSATFDNRHLHDLVNVIKYQCRTGTPLPLNRDGLAKNPERSPLEVLSFEAPKKNYVRLSTAEEKTFYPIKTSTDKMFFGQQFNEGTGYTFAILPRTDGG